MLKLSTLKFSLFLTITSLIVFNLPHFIGFEKKVETQSPTPFSFSQNKNEVAKNDSIPNPPLSCSQSSTWNAAVARTPDLKRKHKKWEGQMRQNYLNRSASSSQPTFLPYELPVVVHVIHDGGPENISDALVQDGILNLNAAFANQGFYDQGVGANTQIQFCLATQAPDGSFTTGINRVQSSLTEMLEPLQDLDVKNLIRWDPLNYINIWVVKQICSGGGDCGTAGYAYLPSAHGTDVDGILIESLYFGSTEVNTSFLIHEMGHYLGLYHTFQGGCNNNDCLADGDRVCDTPPDQTAAPTPCSGSINSCTTDLNSSDPNNPFTTDQDDQTSNFMDYGYIQCYHSFTAGQATRMQDAITTARSSLLNSPTCTSACPTLITSSFDTPTTPINVGSTITFNNTSTGGLYFDWTIDQVPFNGIYTFGIEGTFEITLVVTNDDSNCVASSTAVITVICEAQAALTVDATQAQINSIINFTDNSTNADAITWTVDGMPSGTNPNFQFFSPSVGNFTICLIANNSLCQSEVCQAISIVGNSSVMEICDNGFDDDGDGLIDCYDPDCCDNTNCVDNYFQDCNVIDCDTSTHNEFAIQLEWSTPSSTIQYPLQNAVGDINNDGTPNILQGRRSTGVLQMLNGLDGSVVWSTSIPDLGRPMIADVDKDGTAEIFLASTEFMFRVEHDGTVSAQGPIPNAGGGWFNNHFITDFNEDGTPEIMFLNNIFDVTTLEIIGTLPVTDYTFAYEYGTGVPIDALPASPYCPDCDGLELVLGPFLYSVHPTTFEFTKIHFVAINDPYFSNESTTAIADIDKDGDLDAIVKASELNTLYVWDIQTPTIIAKESDGVFPFATSGHNRPAVADLDGDGFPEIICRNGGDMVAYNGDLLSVDWVSPIQEFGGNATQSIFDINGDGLPEVIYRDNVLLRIISGQTGELLSSIPCPSGTSSELPTIADVDGDGEAEIYCECSNRVHVFGSAGNKPWANARPIWHQKQYYNTNINDDLTVPIIQQQVNLVGDGNIMNSFYQQTVIPDAPVDCGEICDNGIDDDGDGLIDCYDPDCCESAACVSNYYQDCVVEGCDTTVFDDFSIQLEWSTPSSTFLSPIGFDIIAGDITGNGIPDIIQKSEVFGKVNIGSGIDGSTILEISQYDIGRIVIADVDSDGTGELFFGSTDFKRMEHDGTITATVPMPSSAGGWLQTRPTIQDFNQDGKPEIMILNYILDSETLEILSTLTPTDYVYYSDYGLGVPVDVLPASTMCPDCDGLEFVVGPFLYSVHPTTFEFTQIHSVNINDPWQPGTENTTSIADIDKDGDLDAVVRGVGVPLYVWDIQTPTIMYNEANGNFPFTPSSHNMPAIADLDGDGFPEIIARNGLTELVAYNHDLLSVDWVIPISETPGGNATASIFDIDGNGFPEVIFRDAGMLRIINGQTGEVLSSYSCGSGTNSEMPAILDIDADGEAEIACECSGRVHVFGSAGANPWSNTRKVWNQFLNFNVHINDDLTVPMVQQQHHLVGDGNVMNSFLQQMVIPKPLTDCPEICDNGIDDDNDGLIDCEDDDCCQDIVCNNQPTPCDPPCVFVGNVDLGSDVQVCDNGIFNFNAGSGFSSYLWSDQTVDSTFTAVGDGLIWVIATDSCGNTYTDSVTISVTPESIVNLGTDLTLCSGTSASLSGGTFDIYQWYKDEILVCDNCPNYFVTPSQNEQYVLLAGSNEGCYSTDTINIFIETVAIGYDTIYLCAGDTINVFGENVFEAQTLQSQFTTFGACDSISNITIELQNTVTVNQTLSICEGQSVSVFGMDISTDTILQQTSLLSSGCDSTQIIEVVVFPTIETNEMVSLCEGDSVNILNQFIYHDTTILEMLSSSNGCDSTHTYFVSFTNNIQTQEVFEICAGDTINIFGQPTFETGIFSQTFLGNNNCDSIHTIEILTNEVFETAEMFTICEGESVSILNEMIYSDTTITEIVSAANSCDSTHMYFVTVNPTVQTQDLINICNGDSVFIFGEVIFESNILSQNFIGENGCDSTHTIEVILLSSFSTSENVQDCEGTTIIIAGEIITSDTIIIEQLEATNGCDSVHTYFVSFTNNIQTQEAIEICEGDTIDVFGEPTFDAGIFNQTFLGNNNCDSTHTIEVISQNIFHTDETITICEGNSVNILNEMIFSDTTIIASLSATNGCDSTHTYFVSTNPISQTQEVIEICEGDTAIVFGQSIFEQNIISQTFTGVNNCDSTHSVEVLLLNTFETSETFNICEGDSIIFGNITYYADAFFIQNFTALNGCDSAHAITIAFQDAIYQTDTTLLCEDEYVLFFGDTITTGGYYEFNQSPLGIDCDTINQLWVQVNPNPEINTFIDAACDNENNGQIEISNPQADWVYSLDGANFQSTPFFDMLSSGNYQLWVEDENGCMSSSSFEIPNSTLPIITLETEITIQSGFTQNIPVTYSDTSNLQFNWSPATGLSCTTCPFPEIVGATSQTYIVEVTDIYGCATSQIVEVNVATEGIYIPNSFTPNNDGNNDFFTVYAGPSTPKIELLQIFDNWGELVFEIKDFAPNNELLGWDGTLRGQPMMSKVFAYKCIVITPYDGKQTFTGDLTLHR